MEKYQIKLINTVSASTINIPLVMQYQFAGQSELIDKVFVDVRGKNVEFLVTKPPFVESKVR